MKIEGQAGDFYHKALFRDRWVDRNENEHFSPMWTLTPGYFGSREEVVEYLGHQMILWPADPVAEGVVYIPAEEELQ